MAEISLLSYIEDEKYWIAKGVYQLKNKPKLIILTDGVDERCKTYMKAKVKMGEELGIEVEVITLTSTSHLQSILTQSVGNKSCTIMQLPISKEYEIYYRNSLEAQITDVDGFFSYQSIADEEYKNTPCTPRGIMDYMFEASDMRDLDKKSLVIVGRGELTGYPLMAMAVRNFGSVGMITSKTDKHMRINMLYNADVVVLSSGVKGSVKTSELSDYRDVLVFNVGTIFNEGRLEMELVVDEEKYNVSWTPRIKGVGILTVVSLMRNILEKSKGWEK